MLDRYEISPGMAAKKFTLDDDEEALCGAHGDKDGKNPRYWIPEADGVLSFVPAGDPDAAPVAMTVKAGLQYTGRVKFFRSTGTTGVTSVTGWA